MEKLTPTKYFFKYIKNAFTSFKVILKKPQMLLPAIIVSLIWAILSYLVAKGNTSTTIYVLSILTFAQGGMYGGIIGTIGGIIGKGILASFVTKIFIKKEKKKEEKIKGSSFITCLMGVGIGLVIYNFLSSNASLENALIGVTLFFSVIRKAKLPNGFWYGFLPTFSKKITKETVKSLFTGFSFGLASGVVISCIIIEGSFIPYLVGVPILVITSILKLIKKRKPAIVATFLLLGIIFSANPIFAESLPIEGDFNGLKISYNISGVSITSSEDDKDFTTTRTLKGTCSKGTVTVSGTFANSWGANTGVSVTITTSSGSKEFSDTLSDKKKSTSFSISLPVTKNDKNVSISISEDASYGNGQFRGLGVSGTFDNTSYVEKSKKNRLENDSDKKLSYEQDYEDTHTNIEETVIISIISSILSILGLIFANIFSGNIPPNIGEDIINETLESDDEIIIIKDPASGAETGYKRDPNTNEWVSLDGNTILDPDKVAKWQEERQKDKAWMNEQNEKIKRGDTQLARELKEISDKEKADLNRISKESAAEQKKLRDEIYAMIKMSKEREEKRAEMWTKQGNIFKVGEVSAQVVSVICDSAIDIYGHMNPAFARGYKVLRGAAGGFADGWTATGLVEGTIKGTADALLVRTTLSLQNKAFVRFGSRVFASTVGSKLKGENSAQQFNSLTNGAVEGLLHAGTGFAMDKLTMNLPKFKIDEKTAQNVTFNTIKKLFGTEHGGAQRSISRGIRDFVVKPFTNDIKKNKAKIL